MILKKWKSVEESRKNRKDEEEFCNLIYESFYICFCIIIYKEKKFEFKK